jgi:hypothetical protein
LSIHRARPASAEEITAFEEKHRVAVSDELRQFWLVTNGMCFLTQPICGTYDANVFPSPRGSNDLSLVGFPDGLAGDVAFYFAVGQPGARRSNVLPVYEISGEGATIEWAGIRECLQSHLRAVQKSASSAG